MLKKRLLTAIVLITIVLLNLYLAPSWLVMILTGGLVLLAVYEWQVLLGLNKLTGILIFSAILFAFLLTNYFAAYSLLFGCALIFWAVMTLALLVYPKLHQAWHEKTWSWSLIAIGLLTPFWVAIYYLLTQTKFYGPNLLLYALVIVWAADTGAYLFGRKWGQHKLMPAISPGKSWEGLGGGILVAVIVGLGSGYLFQVRFSNWLAGLSLILLTIFSSVIGDLVESSFKRWAGKKDSGALLPGHGGLLDRIDSLTCALPIFAAVLYFAIVS